MRKPGFVIALATAVADAEPRHTLECHAAQKPGEKETGGRRVARANTEVTVLRKRAGW
jgi:hypothetical protein